MGETPATYTVESYTASDDYRCHYRRYLPPSGAAEIPTPPRAHVVCIHGIQSHAGWYEHSCSQLSRAGYLVSFLDRRGAGLNAQGRGDTPGYGRLLQDIADFLHTCRWETDRLKRQEWGRTLPLAHAPTLPLGYASVAPLSDTPAPARPLPARTFLLAISWGGKLAVAFPHRYPGQIDGLILLCPGIHARVGPSLGERCRIAASRLFAPRRLFPVPLQDPELFTATPRWQQFIREDPLSLRQATARFLVSSVFLDRALRSLPARVRIPVLLLLAGKDRVIDNERTRRYVRQFATHDQEILEFPEAAHTLEFEPDPEPFIRTIRGWLDRQCMNSP